MGKSVPLLLLMVVAVVAVAAMSEVAAAGWTIEGEEEFAMDSEVNGRMLAGETGSSFGYMALKSDAVPCSIRGASYYSNCRPGAQVNPYSRGCSVIALCRQSVSR